MSDESDFLSGMPEEEMASYMQLYLDETAEQLDALVEVLLVLEGQPTSGDHLNEAFRLIHSVKGSSAMMGFESITALTHHLENHFERLRSGLRTLDSDAMGLILRCIDFLRSCHERLRAGQSLGGAPELLEQLSQLANSAAEPERGAEISPRAEHEPPKAQPIASSPASSVAHALPARTTTNVTGERDYRISVRFEQDLQLVDLKAELVCNRLSDISEIRASDPPPGQLERILETRWVQLIVTSDHSAAELHQAADVGGVESVEIVESSELQPLDATAVAPEPIELPGELSAPAAEMRSTQAPAVDVRREPREAPPTVQPDATLTEESTADAKPRVAETVRVDIGRLDNLMNLAGELVVNKARFTQLARRMSPAFKKSSISGRARAFGETMRHLLQNIAQPSSASDGQAAASWAAHVREIEEEIEMLEEQSRLWEESRRHFGQITEAIDQLARVSTGLQRGVLDTRMVPVAPLFNRFKRVVRDISHELGKKVTLEIHGEKTELDKRMIDELGDPLVHLVRNAIDHGIERADVRERAGKNETGVLRLEAAHSGNNVFITVSDDGAGIDVEKVRGRLVARGLLTAAAAQSLSPNEVVDYIWHPGFSTADAVSDISGRGVGMDIVKTRILELNGTTTIDHRPGQGTTFTIRLPLTLAIIRSLLFRVRHGVFAVPIENVREIVSVTADQVVTIRDRRAFDVRGEFIPLVDVDEIFDWHDVDYGYSTAGSTAKSETSSQRMNVVILTSATKTTGLRVDELLGGQDIVIKSLAENFVHIRGLSGATILGDGTVSLLLDVGAAIEMAADGHRRAKSAQTLAAV